MFLELDLRKEQYAIRSFAFGGRPYFQVSGIFTSKQKQPVQLVHDIVSCKLTDGVVELFAGVDLAPVTEIKCFVTDSRKSLPVKFACTLIRPEDREHIVRAWHTRSFSCAVPKTDLLAIVSHARNDDDEEFSI
jgi:hypothetical protein